MSKTIEHRAILIKALQGIPGGGILNTWEKNHATALLAVQEWDDVDKEWVEKIQRKYGFNVAGPPGA